MNEVRLRIKVVTKIKAYWGKTFERRSIAIVLN